MAQVIAQVTYELGGREQLWTSLSLSVVICKMGQ